MQSIEHTTKLSAGLRVKSNAISSKAAFFWLLYAQNMYDARFLPRNAYRLFRAFETKVRNVKIVEVQFDQTH